MLVVEMLAGIPSALSSAVSCVTPCVRLGDLKVECMVLLQILGSRRGLCQV